MFSKKPTHTQSDRGFSLIELMITSAIITIVTAIVVVKHASFNNAVLLKNQAYEIALAIREAQVYAVSSKGVGSNFRERYGVHIDTANNQQVLVYIESTDSGPGSKIYNGTEQVIETMTLDSRFEVSDICVPDGSGGTDCDSAHLSLSFQRPDFDPTIKPSGTSVKESVTITIASASDPTFTRDIQVTQSGQISVK